MEEKPAKRKGILCHVQNETFGAVRSGLVALRRSGGSCSGKQSKVPKREFVRYPFPSPPKKKQLLKTSLRKVSKVCKLKDKARVAFAIFLWDSIHAWHFSVQSFQESPPPLTIFLRETYLMKRCSFFSALADSSEASGPATPPQPGGVPHQGGRGRHREHRGRQREPGNFSCFFFSKRKPSVCPIRARNG